ncbi:MAG: UbiD family decarboxylase domain-containing protein, partial [Anaerolineae bacterium]
MMEEEVVRQKAEVATGPRRRSTESSVRPTQPGLTQQGIHDLQSAIGFMEDQGDLARIEGEVDLKYELAGIAQKLEGGRCALFEQVKGSPYGVLVGLYWNRHVLARMFGCDVRQLPFVIGDAISEWQSDPIDPVVVDSAPCQEVIVSQPDLRKLPIPTHALKDGGPYIDSAIVVARDPDTGVRNASIMRFMVAGPDVLTGQMDEGRHLRDYYERAEARGEPLEMTISNGVDPSIHFAAAAPASAAPIDRDELGIASHLRGEPLELVPGKFVSVEAIASAQFVIEVEALPDVRQPEGPFAEVTGYYAPRQDRWAFRVKGITMRRHPIWQTILSGKEVYNSVGLLG